MAQTKTLLTENQLKGLFVNRRGERVSARVELINDPVRGNHWRLWAAQNFPASVFRTLRMIEAPGSGEWANVVEHCIFVAAASLTLTRWLEAGGQELSPRTVIQAAMVHDAAKRQDIEENRSREAETFDTLLAETLVATGFGFDVITAALNTGRAADRYITDPTIRLRHIQSKGLEAAVVAYCDARTRGSHIVSLSAAQTSNLQAKTRPEDQTYFGRYWMSYYQAVEGYLLDLVPHLDLAALTDEAVYERVKAELHPLSTR